MAEPTKKKTVARLLTADFVITMDEDYTIYAPGAVAIDGDALVAIGPQEEILATYAGKEQVDAGNAAIMPGLVNAHGHVPMTLLRGLADDLRLDVWLMGYMMPVEREFVNPRFCWLGTQLAAAEMIRSGTTTFMDMYYFEEAVADATAQAGLRGVCAQSILKFPSPDAGSYEEALDRARDFIMRWKNHPLIIPALAPHAPYTVTPELIKGAVAIALEFDSPLHIHIAETAQEVEDHRNAYDMPPVPWLKKLGVFETKATAAHCVHIDEGEMHTFLHYNVGVAHNPSSNLKLSSGFAPVKQMLDMGLNVGIGTDGPASNNDLDMFEELRLATMIAKGITMDPTTLPARQTLEMATIMGARAMHIEDLTGSLEPGKRADLIILGLDKIRQAPHFRRDPESIYSRIVYASHAEDVRDMLVNGKWLMRNRQLLTVNTAALRAEADALAGKIDKFLIQREESVLSKLVAIGGVAQEHSFEIQLKAKVGSEEELKALEERLKNAPGITITRGSRRRQYDTYYAFDDPWGNRLRYREDEVIHLDSDEVITVIYRLTLTTQAKEREYEHSIILSRARFNTTATHSKRFYKEYFAPETEIDIEKERRRFHIQYGGTDFALNLDRIIQPKGMGCFLEIKSRTWSRQDAECKASLIGKLMDVLEVPEEALVRKEYLDIEF
ncbi:MAG: amidohydrolase family protein [Anaerolineae bacterium]|nr:amidohydrolase family protein [Anaerolineae bacterium]